MKTPPHLKGLVGAIIAAEKACKACTGTDFDWLVRTDGPGRYFANIANRHADVAFPQVASTPAGALSRAVMEFNLRIKRSKP